MAKRFLTDINLTGNQIIQASLEKLASDPVADLFEGRMYYNTAVDKIKYYNGTAWVVIGEAGDIALGTNTSGNYVADLTAGTGISVSGGNQETANITVTNSDRGSSQNIFKNISDGTTSVVADNNDDTVTFSAGSGISVTANATTDTLTIANTDAGSAQAIFKNIAVSGQSDIVADTNNDTLTVAGGTGITVTTNATTDTLTVTNSGVTSIAGTANEVNVSGSTGSVTIGLPDSVQITTDLTVGGNLTVNGTTTTLNTTELLVEDNIITLNSGVTGTPALNAGIEVERGTSANVFLRWNESTDTWELTRDGTNYEEITTVGTVTSGDISDFAEAAQDAVGGILVDGTTVDFTYADGTPSITAEVKLATTSYLSGASGLAVDISSVETKLVTDGFTKKAAASVGNGSNTSFAVTHNLGTRDVQVQVFDNATYDTIECDVVRTDINNVTVSFATAPASNAYRVVVIG